MEWKRLKPLELINNEAKVILLTGVCQRLELDFMRHGADPYVPKPVDHYTLSNGVYRIVRLETIGIKTY